jgi:hypothetical protein
MIFFRLTLLIKRTGELRDDLKSDWPQASPAEKTGRKQYPVVPGLEQMLRRCEAQRNQLVQTEA